MKPSTWQSKQTGDLRADPFGQDIEKLPFEPAKTDKIANQSAQALGLLTESPTTFPPGVQDNQALKNNPFLTIISPT